MQYEDHYKLRTYAEYETANLIAEMANNEWMRREAIFKPELEGPTAALPLRDLYDVFKGQDGKRMYADPRHPNGEGAALVAARIYGDLKPALLNATASTSLKPPP